MGEWPDGEFFDSTYEYGEAHTSKLRDLILGWEEALLMMVEGDQWELYIPPHLAYGDVKPPPPIGPGNVTVFVVELVEIVGNRKPARICDVKTLANCTDTEKKFVEKHKSKGAERAMEELKRLEGMKGEVFDKKLKWFNSRIKLLTQMKEEL